MANVLFKRGNTATINGTAVTDGQLLYNTTTGQHYIDSGSTRKEVGQSRVSNCILEMPTKPTYSGLTVTVYAGTKVLIPNGRNTDGTLKNTIHIVESNITSSVSLNNASAIMINSNNECFHIWKSTILYADRLSNRPTTVSGTFYYVCYCEETNLWYSTTGSTTANWQVTMPFAIVATAIVGASAITSLVPRDTLKFAQQEDINALTNSIINTTAEVNAITADNIPCGTKPVKDIITSLNVVTGTLSIGATSVTISNARITTDSILDFYTSIYGVNPLTVTVSAGQVVLTFPVQTIAMIVGVRING